MDKKLLFSGIIMFVLGLAMALVSAFIIQPINYVAFIILLVTGCLMVLFGFIMMLVGLTYEPY